MRMLAWFRVYGLWQAVRDQSAPDTRKEPLASQTSAGALKHVRPGRDLLLESQKRGTTCVGWGSDYYYYYIVLLWCIYILLLLLLL